MSVKADSVVLVRVRVACPGETKKDDFLTKEMRDQYSAHEGWLNVRKKIFDLSDITRHRDRMRKTLRDEAIPWSSTKTDEHGNKKQDPLWAIPSVEAKALLETLQGMREDFFTAVRNYDYDAAVERARIGSGGAFNKDDFPTKKEFQERFQWDVEVIPLMDVADAENDFRLKLPKKAAEEQVKRYKESLDTKVTNGVKDIMRRAVENLVGTEKKPGLVPRLRDYDPDPDDKRKNNTFRDASLYKKLDDFSEWIDGMNTFLDNQELRDLQARLDDFISNVRPDDPSVVRDDERVRKDVIAGLMGVLDETNKVVDSAPTTEKKSGFDQLL